MIANTEITLITLLENKQIVFDLIDYADRHGAKGSADFSVPLYSTLVSRVAAYKGDPERRKLIGILSLDNLQKNDLLAFWDARADTFMLQDYVITMFRHLESHRLHELSDAQLNGLHVRLKDISVDVSSNLFPWRRDDVLYQEKYGHTIGTLRDIGTRIDQNVASLKGQAKHLSVVANSGMSENKARTEQVQEALKSIYDLVERYIRPTMEFLNPDADWRGGEKEPPMKLYMQILQRFEDNGFTEEYSTISRIYWNIVRTSEEIAVIRKGLDVYVKLYEEQRKLYNVIEKRYNAFYERVAALHDGRLNYNQLSAQLDPDVDISALSGIKTHINNQGALLGYRDNSGSAHLDEHLRIRLPKIRALKRDVVDAAKSKPTIDEDDRRERRCFKNLMEATRSIRIEAGKDAYELLHDHLSKEMDDYRLADLVDVYSAVINARQEVKLQLDKRRRITHNGKELNYYERTLTGKKIAS